MKNLENLQLQELTIEEQVNTEGGFLPVAVIVGIWAIEAAICIGLVAVASDHAKK